MWPIKEKENRQLVILSPKFYPLWQAVQMHRYGSLIDIDHSALKEIIKSKQLS